MTDRDICFFLISLATSTILFFSDDDEEADDDDEKADEEDNETRPSSFFSPISGLLLVDQIFSSIVV